MSEQIGERRAKLLSEFQDAEAFPSGKTGWELFLVSRIAELEQQARWIPCSERLPVNDSPVLVHGGCAYYRHDAGWFTLMGDDAHRPITWNVTHWKPLPPPPSENDNG